VKELKISKLILINNIILSSLVFEKENLYLPGTYFKLEIGKCYNYY
jgi:hypothetical protein